MDRVTCVFQRHCASTLLLCAEDCLLVACFMCFMYRHKLLSPRTVDSKHLFHSGADHWVPSVTASIVPQYFNSPWTDATWCSSKKTYLALFARIRFYLLEIPACLVCLWTLRKAFANRVSGEIAQKDVFIYLFRALNYCRLSTGRLVSEVVKGYANWIMQNECARRFQCGS